MKLLYFCLNKLHWGRVNLEYQVCDLKSAIVSYLHLHPNIRPTEPYKYAAIYLFADLF